MGCLLASVPTLHKDDHMAAAPRSLTLLALLGAGALLFAGCATATPTSEGVSESPAATEIEIEAGWLDGGRQIALVTWGSSGCIPTASDATLQADGSVAVTLDNGPDDQVCTADYAPRVTLVGVPEGVDPTQMVGLVVTDNAGGRGETDLGGVPGLAAGGATDYAPSAGWVDAELIALLTWGSSTCAPRVESVEASDPSHLDVTFVTPPADQACTMDMAPRALLVSVGDLDVLDPSAGALTLTLTGGDAQFATPVEVAVVG